jgi:hypothetical protein
MKVQRLFWILCLPWGISCGDAEVSDVTGYGGQAHGGAGPSIGGPDFALAFEEIALEGDPTLVTHFAFLPNSDEFLAATQAGRVLHYSLEESATRLLGEFEIDVFAEMDCGLISLAFDPTFEESGFVYFGHCVSSTHSAITRYEFDPDDYEGIADTRSEVLEVGYDQAKRPVHSVGKLGFDGAGNMWALFGEKERGLNARDPTYPLGAVVRLRPREEGGYAAPVPPNPLFPGSPTIPLVYAYGLRSPWTGALDAQGRLWVADVGGNGDGSFEELNLVTEPGLDFGWNLHQGPCRVNCAGQRDPIRSWKRRPIGDLEFEDPELASTTNRVAWVGVEYREAERDRYDGLMYGKVLYGDMCLGFVRGLEIDDDENVVFDRQLGHLAGASAWQVGPDGYIYAVTYARCLHGLNVTPPVGKLMRARLSRD